jgi:hypothetical protein
MKKVWDKLEHLDNLYSEVFKKAGNIKGEMICMGLFTGICREVIDHSCTDVLIRVYFEMLPYFENYLHALHLGFWKFLYRLLFCH